MRIAALGLSLLSLPLAFAHSGMQDKAAKSAESSDGPKVGAPAPAFRLNDHNGRLVRIGGKSDTWTVIAFYPKAATPG